jgi:hypothetical protein
MARNHGPVRPRGGWPVRAFTVVEESMRPRLDPGDVVIAVRGGRPRTGQVRVFRHPRMSSRWVVKTVGEVFTASGGTIFEARSENSRAVGASDSHDFGPVSAAGTYRMVWRLRGRGGADPRG